MFASGATSLLLDGSAFVHLPGSSAEDVLDDKELPLGKLMKSHILERLDARQVELEPEVTPAAIGVRGKALDLLAFVKRELYMEILLGLLCNDADVPLQIRIRQLEVS